MMLFIVIGVVFLCLQSVYVYAEEIVEKDIQYEFAIDSVLVVMDEEVSDINKVHSASYFTEIEISDIKDLTKKERNKTSKNSDFRQILQIFLKKPSKENVLQAVNRLNEIEGVYSAEPNCNEVRVGIIDTGIANHSDLNSNLITGWDFFNNNNVTTDDTHSHGTHVAGTIGAVGNNNIGVTGINWNVTLVPLQAANTENRFYESDAVEAILWAEEKWGTAEQIDIINYSVGGFGERTAVREAVRNYHGLFIWSAGNDSKNVDTLVSINGSFDLPNLVSVGSLTSLETRSDFSNYGVNSVNIYAPGSNILSTTPTSLCSGIVRDTRWGERLACECIWSNQENEDGVWEWVPVSTHIDTGYHSMSGTSMAAPHVTGVAALLLSVNPTLTGAELKDIIINSADNISITVPNGSGGTTTQTVKKLNAFTAVSTAIYETTDIGTNEIQIDGTDHIFDGKLTIPTTINGRTVTKIGNSAFSNQNLCEEIVFPESLEIIGDSAFENCTSLTEIHIPSSVTEIGDEAFKGCNGVTELIFEDDSNLYYIGSYAFYGCTSLEEVTIPSSVVFIRKSAFEFCTGMETLTFEEGSSLRYSFGLEDNAFAYCQSLSEINYNVWGLADFNSESDVFAMARDSADIQLNIGAEVVRILD